MSVKITSRVFENVHATVIIVFIKEIGFYHPV